MTWSSSALDLKKKPRWVDPILHSFLILPLLYSWKLLFFHKFATHDNTVCVMNWWKCAEAPHPTHTHTCFIASRASSKAWATFVAMEASKASSKILLWTTSTSIYSMYLLDAEQTTLYFHIDRENELYCIILHFIAYTSFGKVNWYKKEWSSKMPIYLWGKSSGFVWCEWQFSVWHYA